MTGTFKPYSKADSLGRRIIRSDIPADKGPEDRLQEQLEKYLQAQKLPYLHIPNRIAKKGSGKYTGWADLLIFKPYGKYNLSLMIELKSLTGTFSSGQKRKGRELVVYESRAFDHAVKLIQKFIRA